MFPYNLTKAPAEVRQDKRDRCPVRSLAVPASTRVLCEPPITERPTTYTVNTAATAMPLVHGETQVSSREGVVMGEKPLSLGMGASVDAYRGASPDCRPTDRRYRHPARDTVLAFQDVLHNMKLQH